MSLKQRIKEKICSLDVTANYPLEEFVCWAGKIDRYVVLYYLEVIQRELDVERLAMLADGENDAALRECWCAYCAKAIRYYRAILGNPCRRFSLSFLLNSLPQRLQR
ncbi:MAG TPA: hypothetical protein VIM59_11610 [Cellvibrio sp.]